MKIVCIGNSIVNGYPLKRSQCFVSLWRQATGYDIINKGQNGDITSNILARFERDVISHKPSAVLVLSGTNDFIYQVSTPSGVMNNMVKMIELAKRNSIDVLLMTPLLVDPSMAKQNWIPDADYNMVNENLKSLRNLMLDYDKENGVKIIDAQEKFTQLYTDNNISDYLLDGLHPTVLGHEAMARFLQD